ncbi:FAD-dependent oxidoreductase [Candidatus Dependentiae bacterium]|nr:FAD-dependent oxidoreductase [Candidatus Dependentiae bacterium]MBU4387173.1 FAD-dependent oxidoreductase [Candidatus Dependentiae bacterium]MCG2755930.1 FAD-dependent oxidoreductase [Candidatus Dependentiae bacterium]
MKSKKIIVSLGLSILLLSNLSAVFELSENINRTNPKNVAVVGGGMAGLTTAIILIDNGCNVTLLESQNYIGGKLYSEEIGGIQSNLGAQYVFDAMHPVIDYYINIIRKKKLNDLKTGYIENGIYNNLTLLYLLKIMSAIGIMSEDRAASLGDKAFYFDKLPDNQLWNQFENMTTNYYLNTYKTLDPDAAKYIAANLKSETGGDLNNLMGLMPVGWYGDLEQGDRYLLKDGNESLAVAIKDDIVAKGGTVLLEKTVTNVAVNGEAVTISCLDSSNYTADYVVIATPSYIAKNIVSGLSTEKTNALNAVDYSKIAIVSLYVKNFPTGNDLHGVLYLDDNNIGGFLSQTGSILNIGKSNRYLLKETNVVNAIVTNETLLNMSDVNLVNYVATQLQTTEPNFNPNCDVISYLIKRYDKGIVKFPLQYLTNYQAQLQAPVSNKIFFAGDYIYSPDLAGAAWAGDRAAQAILAQ